MPAKVRDQGQYEMFESENRHTILVLNGKQWIAAVKGQQGDLLVQTSAGHGKQRSRQKGQFYLVDFKDDPKFKDMEHLFLEKGSQYQELMLPQGLPSGRDKQKKVVWTEDTIKRQELEQYLKQPAKAGPGEERMDRPGGGSVANVAHYLKGVDLPAKKADLVRYAQDHRAPKAVIQQLDQMGDGSFATMADVMKGLGGKQQADGNGQARRSNQGSSKGSTKGGSRGSGNGDKPPIANYDQMTVREVAQHLSGLDKRQLEQVRRYEEQHKQRKTVLEAIERKTK